MQAVGRADARARAAIGGGVAPLARVAGAMRRALGFAIVSSGLGILVAHLLQRALGG